MKPIKFKAKRATLPPVIRSASEAVAIAEKEMIPPRSSRDINHWLKELIKANPGKSVGFSVYSDSDGTLGFSASVTAEKKWKLEGTVHGTAESAVLRPDIDNELEDEDEADEEEEE